MMMDIKGEGGNQKDHEYCLRCGRKLKNPIARQRGYGTVCEKKMRIAEARRLFDGGRERQASDDANLQSS